MITMDLRDRFEYKIGSDWSVHEVLCIKCPKCGKDTIEVITYQDMTLFYHEAEIGTQLVNSCTIHKGTHIQPREEPFFEVLPMRF